jgi:hypothetical protein
MYLAPKKGGKFALSEKAQVIADFEAMETSGRN